MSKKLKKSFTLIELLVVISIIGILSGFLFVSMSDAINSAKDVRRKVDLETIQKSIFIYAVQHDNTYPSGSNCNIGAEPGNNPCSDLATKLEEYLPALPQDPNSGVYYVYNSPSSDSFTLQAILSTSGTYEYDSSINAWSETVGFQAAPTFSAVSGIIAFGSTVVITSASADAIYYTTDGSNPTTSSVNQAVTPLVINSDVNVKALAVRSGYTNSAISSIVYSACGDTVTFTYNGSSVIYGEVISQASKCWLDRNLGAGQVATTYNDSAAYGDLFQWGRGIDGHQIRTSGTSTTLSGGDSPGHGNFIMTNVNPYDWRSPQNNNLWQGISGINNPCPTDWRLPTLAEWNAEIAAGAWGGRDDAYASPLKLPAAGFRQYNTGSLSMVDINSCYWTSTASGIGSYSLSFGTVGYNPALDVRARGFSVRCIKD